MLVVRATEIIKCDVCQKEAILKDADNWFKLKQIRTPLLHYPNVDGIDSLDFCSVICVRNFTNVEFTVSHRDRRFLGSTSTDKEMGLGKFIQKYLG